MGIYKERVGEVYRIKNGDFIKIVEYYDNRNIIIEFIKNGKKKKTTYQAITGGKITEKLNRVGEKYTTNEGYEVEIIEYKNNRDCTIKFEDGTLKYKVEFMKLKRGVTTKPVLDKIGEEYTTNQGYTIKVIEYFNCNNCTIQFNDERNTILKNVYYCRISTVENPYHKTICGVGYIGEGSHSSKHNGVFNKSYLRWSSMIRRCYDEKVQKKYPTYKDVTVCEEWYNFQNYAKWYEENYIEGFEVDKDILQKTNKTYSPNTCEFVPREINCIFTTKTNRKESLPRGVHRKNNRFQAIINIKNLGTFNTSEEAFEAYKSAKEDYIKELANKWRGQITERCYNALINYKVEITD